MGRRRDNFSFLEEAPHEKRAHERLTGRLAWDWLSLGLLVATLGLCDRSARPLSSLELVQMHHIDNLISDDTMAP